MLFLKLYRLSDVWSRKVNLAAWVALRQSAGLPAQQAGRLDAAVRSCRSSVRSPGGRR